MKGHEQLKLARALYQLQIYFKALHLPFTLDDLYRIAYGDDLWELMPGATWLNHLQEDPTIVAAKDEFFTLWTIFETLERAGLALLLEVIEEETARLGIGMGVIRPGHYRQRPPSEADD
jgi:hypothetical protein